MNTNWTVTFNDGIKVVLQRETETSLDEATIRRPPNKLSRDEWLKAWFVGRLLTGDGLREEVLRLEIVWGSEQVLQQVRKENQQLDEFRNWFAKIQNELPEPEAQ
jgi:hypothetical protein